MSQIWKYLFGLLIFCVHFVSPKNQYVLPLNMGMQVAIPYDIANIWNNPVHFSPVAAIASAVCLLCILFFGVITSPFGYFFGVPSQKYVMGDAFHSLNTSAIGRDDFDYPYNFEDPNDYYIYSEQGRSFNFTENIRNIVKDFPDFHKIFLTSPQLQDAECRKMVLCGAHSAFKLFPQSFLTVYQFFSKKLMNIGHEYKDAILSGIKGKDYNNCEKKYPSCNDSLFGIAIRSLVNLMPKWSRKKPKSIFSKF